ncbi:MAG: phosphatase PAP2 family protein [Oceanicola sp.]|nr:phosphatase PAP2 family protein [Oceanicola sp.]
MASMASGGAGATSQQTLAAASSGALIGSRDGIVGRYTDPVYTPAADGSVGLPHLPFDSIDMLEFWESGVRLSSIHLEILTELRFTSSGGDTLIISDRSGTAGEMPLLEIARPSMEEFFAQLPLVHAYSDLRVDRAQEILAQVGEIMSFIGQPISLHPQRHKNTIEFLFAAVGAVIEVQKRVKAALAVRRPFELSAQIQPMITTPAHSAFPSGHAMEAFCMAEVLAQIVAPLDDLMAPGSQTRRQQMMLQAARVGINRTVAGVHYPIDTMSGALVGRTLGLYVMSRALGGSVAGQRFESPFDPAAPDAVDFSLTDLNAAFDPDATSTSGYYHATGTDVAPAPAPMLAWLLERARKEWTAGLVATP